jgi:hypothetical protein
MNNIKKTVGINLILLVLLALIITIPMLTDELPEDGGGYNTLGYLIVYALVIAIQSIINLLVSLFFFISKNNEMGKAFLLSFILVLAIGFSSCMAIFSR